LANHRVVQRLAGPGTDIGWGRVRGGHHVCAPLGDYVGRAVYYVGDLDRKITWLCSRLVRPGDTVIDIGANLGLVTMVLSSLVGPTGAVHAFEPIPQMQELIDRSIARNRTTNVRLHRCALGAAADVLTLSVPRGHAGSASFLAERQHEDSDRVDVPVRTLSEVLADEAVGPVRLVKIDVEGFEPEVLAGAETHFAQYPPDAILFELNDHAVDVSSHPTIALLDKLAYGFFSIPKTVIRVRVARFDPANPAPNTGALHDFLAIRRDRYEEVARLLGANG
jgi:FkbM family methyltransferase